ncbi:MAG: hypothetical protein U0736_04970 [Gemmataceae bacterium]
MTYMTHLSDGAIDTLLAHEGAAVPAAAAQRAAACGGGGVYHLTVYRRQGGYGWLIGRPRAATTYAPTTYATEQEALQAATDAVTA